MLVIFTKIVSYFGKRKIHMEYVKKLVEKNWKLVGS